MLSLAVVLQLVPFLYMFAALVKFAFGSEQRQGRYSRGHVDVGGSQRIC